MNEDIVESFRQIFKIAQDETYTSQEALDVIMDIVEHTLSLYGHEAEPEE